MKPRTATRLLDLNKQFYQTFGRDFSSTRQRLQPGVKRFVERLNGDEALLDLGCGNANLAQALALRGHHGPYLGLDFSQPLLDEARGLPENFCFVEADLAGDWIQQIGGPADRKYDWIVAFATLHHIPGEELRRALLGNVHDLLASGGLFIHSNWQFLHSARLRSRIQPWEAAGIEETEVDPGDHLLDWRSGGHGLRYVHAFDKTGLAALAAATGFRVRESFLSDGENGRLGLYQIWEAD